MVEGEFNIQQWKGRPFRYFSYQNDRSYLARVAI